VNTDAEAYDAQRRGDACSYQRYLAGMDASMRQKIALTAAFLRSIGRVADMGMGSGSGSDALAALYPSLMVMGVDVDPRMVDHARTRFQRPNLAFQIGDLEDVRFEQPLEGILMSSVLHHVTSFNGYEDARAGRAIRAQSRNLARHGVLIVRDFVAPRSGLVWLDLPADDGQPGDDPETCSTAALFQRFSREYRLLSSDPGFSYRRLARESGVDLAEGWQRFEVDRRLAYEFVLRKDYRSSWNAEVKEAFTYFTQDQFESCLASAGLRVLASNPIRNPWIVRNRFEGRFVVREPGSEWGEEPPTNYIIVGERVGPEEGVEIRGVGPQPRLDYLEMASYRDMETGRIKDLVRRPNTTLDILPWFQTPQATYLVARGSYPRPILNMRPSDEQPLDTCRCAGYVTEPLIALQTDLPQAEIVSGALYNAAGIDAILRFDEGPRYFPSPGGVMEHVQSVYVQIKPRFDYQPSADRRAPRILSIELTQLLRSAQVGGLPDARLEIGAYDLGLRAELDMGPWIAADIEIDRGPRLVTRASAAVLCASARRRFVKLADDAGSGFMSLRAAEFEERGADGRVVGSQVLEYVVPSRYSCTTISTAIVVRDAAGYWLGVDDFDLAVAQAFTGNSNIPVVPAWRLPKAIKRRSQAMAWITDRVDQDYGVETRAYWELGGRYHPSLGITPEVIYPYLVLAGSRRAAPRELAWVRLEDLLEHRDLLMDCHLRVVAFRLAHALGMI